MPNFNLQINWDFDAFSKKTYFQPPIESSYDLYFPLKCLSHAFYEINAKDNINLYFEEVQNNESIFAKDLKFPFIYIRNIGQCNLYINASRSVCTFESSLINKTSGFQSLCNYDYILKTNENIILTFCSSQNGSKYFSQSNFPFGFFYKFDNIQNINPSGCYPVCCYEQYGESYMQLNIYTGTCESSFVTTCVINDYQYEFLDYYYCWKDVTNDLVFYKKTINEIFTFAIECLTGSYGYEYIENNLCLVSGESAIDLNPINNLVLNCYYLYENNFYCYGDTGFDYLICNNFQNSGFNLTGSCYILTGTCVCTFTRQFEEEKFYTTYHPTYLYEDLDASVINQYSGTGYMNFIYSNGFCSQVDSGSNLYISFKKDDLNLLDPISLKSSNGNINFCSSIHSIANLENINIDTNFSGIKINSDCCINIFYRINNCNNLFFPYSLDYCNLTNLNCVKLYDSYGNLLSLANYSSCICYSKECSTDCDAYIKFKLNNSSLSGLDTKTLCRNSFVLPTAEHLDFEYCFELNNLNYGFENCISGSWDELCNFESVKEKMNCLTVINTGYDYFISNSPEIHYLDLNLSNSSVRFNSRLCSGNSEDFTIKKLDKICYFYFSGIEYRYTPIDYITYNGIDIEIPNCCININYTVSGKNLTFDFPIKALDYGQIYVHSDFTFSNKYCNFNLNLKYNNLDINIHCDSMDQIIIPKIKAENSNYYESPCLNLSFSNDRVVCEDVCLIASLNNSYIEPNNDLYNFYIYMYSYFNLDTNCLCSLSGLKYNSDEYLFNFLKLEKDLNYLYTYFDVTIPVASYCVIVSEKISGCHNYNLFPYKSYNNDLYNYASVVLNKISYCTCLCNTSCIFETTGLLTNNNIAFNTCSNNICSIISYSGNNKNDLDYLSQVVRCNGYAQVGDCYYLIKLDDRNFSGSSSCISLNNEYIVTGTQPFTINSNNPIQLICGDVLYNNYSDYNLLCFKYNTGCFNSTFYYTYAFDDCTQKDLLFKVDGGMYIERVNFYFPSICTILNTEQNNESGLMYKNMLNLTYPFCEIISNNSLECQCYLDFKINIVSCL